MSQSIRTAAVPLAFVVFLLAAGARVAAAAGYAVRDVPRTASGTELRAGWRPAINDEGVVAFKGAAGGATVQDPPRSFVVRARRDGTVAATFIPAEDDHFSRVALGQAGATTILGNSLLRVGPDGTITRLVEPSGAYLSLDHFAAPRSGDRPVVFEATPSDGPRGIFDGPDASDDRLDDPDLQTSPQLVGVGPDGSPRFVAMRPGVGLGVFKGSDPVADLVLDLSKFNFVSEYSENGRGDVLIAGTSRNGVTGLFTGNDPAADRITAVPGAVTGALNGNGHIVLSEPSGTVVTRTAMYLYTPSGAQRILGQGDPLFGSTLRSFFFDPQAGFNDLGELAFTYTLANGKAGIAVVAVPEAGVGVIGMGVAALGVLRRRH